MICKFCKRDRPLTEKEEYYEICDKCYWGMRLEPDVWLEWLRTLGQEAVRVRVGRFVPKEEWYEGIDEDRLNKLIEFIRKEI